MAMLSDLTPGSTPPPVCTHCGKELDSIALYNWLQTQWAVLAANCPHCRAILHMQVVPIAIATGEPS
jgi:hypothetical protein